VLRKGFSAFVAMGLRRLGASSAHLEDCAGLRRLTIRGTYVTSIDPDPAAPDPQGGRVASRRARHLAEHAHPTGDLRSLATSSVYIMKNTCNAVVPRTIAATAICLFTSALAVLAHHSLFADFDRTQEKQYRATVSSFAWTNPHASFQAIVVVAGAETAWMFELPAPYGLERVGWMRDTVKPNDRVVITGFPARDGSKKASVHRVTLSNGRTLELDHPFAYQPDYRPPN